MSFESQDGESWEGLGDSLDQPLLSFLASSGGINQRESLILQGCGHCWSRYCQVTQGFTKGGGRRLQSDKRPTEASMEGKRASKARPPPLARSTLFLTVCRNYGPEGFIQDDLGPGHLTMNAKTVWVPTIEQKCVEALLSGRAPA